MAGNTDRETHQKEVPLNTDPRTAQYRPQEQPIQKPEKRKGHPGGILSGGSPDPDCLPQVSDWGSSLWWSCVADLAADWLQVCRQDIGVVYIADHLEHGRLERDNWGEAMAHLADHDTGSGESHCRFFLRPQIDVHRQGRQGDLPPL